ncbi:MAG TPA: outer membrane beta-barrel protein [Phnomibacter sp.]|nr:outer membrane beta-barrel protein [Phnomibacter sp.]
MKKCIFVVGLVLQSLMADSQVLISLIFGDKLNSGNIEFGLDGGYSFSNLKGAVGSNSKGAFNLGFYFDIKTKHPNWMVSTGVVVKGPMGAKGQPVYLLHDPALDSAFKGGSVTTKLNYFYVPVNLKYTFKNRIFLKGGIQMGLINSASDLFLNNVKDEDDLTYKLSRKKDFAALDFGLAAGVGYRISKGMGMNININYYYGLIDVEVDDDKPNVMNQAWYFNVGIPIGKGKAMKKAEAKKAAKS